MHPRTIQHRISRTVSKYQEESSPYDQSLDEDLNNEVLDINTT